MPNLFCKEKILINVNPLYETYTLNTPSGNYLCLIEEKLNVKSLAHWAKCIVEKNNEETRGVS